MKFIKNVQLHLKVNQEKISRMSLRFCKGRHLHHDVWYDITHYPEGLVILSSIKMIYYLKIVLTLSSLETIWLFRKHPEDHYVARLKHYLHLVPRMTWRVNMHASRKIMHRESISMHHRKSCNSSQYPCIVSQYPCIAEDHASWVTIHASLKIMHGESIFMHRRRPCIAG